MFDNLTTEEKIELIEIQIEQCESRIKLIKALIELEEGLSCDTK